MHRLFEFLRSVYVVVLFIVLESIAINFYAHSSIYTQAKMLSYSNSVVGGVQGFWSGIWGYFRLHGENQRLIVRVAELENELSGLRAQRADSLLWVKSQVEADENQPYTYVTAKVVSNTINKLENYIVVNRGEKDGVRKNMAVVTPDGAMVGYVTASSQRYSVVISMLNTKFKTSGKIEGQTYMGAISWSGENRYCVGMHDLSKYAEVSEGAEIISTGYSQIFPEGISIGSVVSSQLNEGHTAYDVNIELSADISALDEVLIISNNNYTEVEDLLNEAGNN